MRAHARNRATGHGRRRVGSVRFERPDRTHERRLCMRNRLVTTTAGTLLAAGLLGCEGQTSGHIIGGPSGDARVRVFNALTSSESINLLVDGQVAASTIAFGAP